MKVFINKKHPHQHIQWAGIHTQHQRACLPISPPRYTLARVCCHCCSLVPFYSPCPWEPSAELHSGDTALWSPASPSRAPSSLPHRPHTPAGTFSSPPAERHAPSGMEQGGTACNSCSWRRSRRGGRRGGRGRVGHCRCHAVGTRQKGHVAPGHGLPGAEAQSWGRNTSAKTEPCCWVKVLVMWQAAVAWLR